MTYLKIEAVELTALDGSDVVIHGIDPSRTDCWVGKIMGLTARWDLTGVCRSHSASFNLQRNSAGFIELEEFTKAVFFQPSH